MDSLFDVPYIDHSINPTLDEPDLFSEIKQTCTLAISSWKNIPLDSIDVSIISGGISNALYKVTPKTISIPPVALRIYGANTEKFIDRTKEVTTMVTLHMQGFGPQILGIFSNGRIESFLKMQSLSPEEMSSAEFVPRIAETLAKFHRVNASIAPSIASTPFTRIYEWLDIVAGLDFSDDKKKEDIFAQFDLHELKEQVKEVEYVAQNMNSPIVFAHNDLLSGNIMVNDTEMTFIDFEYADWAPRGFDLGNHFCEYAGFDCDYSRYPDRSRASLFAKNYIKMHSTLVAQDPNSPGDKHGYPSVETIDAEIDKLVVEANVYSLAAHMYWGTWAMMQAKWSAIDFDYMGYAALRWAEYRKRKEEFLEQAHTVF